jgi:PmbA protein
MADGTPEHGDLEVLGDLVSAACKNGADAADAVLIRGISMSQTQRLGETELLEREEGQDLGLRVLVGAKQAVVSSTDLGTDALGEIVERAVAMARAVPDDPYCGLADPAALATFFPDVDAADPSVPSQAELEAAAASCEEAALAVTGVTNSEGASASWGSGSVALAASNGFAGHRQSTNWGIGVSVIAGDGAGMETDYDYTSAVYRADMEDPAIVGQRAGERAVRLLDPRKVETTQVPIVFEPRVSRGIVGHFAGAISGPSIARGTSFLKDKMGEQIFPEAVNIIDDPFRPRGLRSRPFDAEGIAPQRRALIENGGLTGWVLDLSSARQLGLESTGNASRGPSSPPSPSVANLYMEPGEITPEAMVADIDQGFFVTSLMGHGINPVTGDYSRGASGFWIESGQIAYPVSELTIAGNLVEMFQNLVVANDLEFRYGTDAPTLRIDGMTVAGATG